MSDLFVGAKFQAFDADGDPLSGGLLYTYVPGTSTAKATYADEDLATANANPVVLDDRGEATIFLSGTTKFVLKTAAGVTIWTRDEVDGIDQGEYAAQYYVDDSETDQGAAGDGSSLKDIIDAVGTSKQATIVFSHTGVGNTTAYTLTTAETVPSNFNLVFERGAIIDGAGTLTVDSADKIDAQSDQQIFGSSITVDATYEGTWYPGWFGCVGDSSTDDSTPFQAAMTSAGGGRLLIPAGRTYMISDIDVPGSVRISGGGTLKQVALLTTDGSAMLNITGEHISINEIAFDGNKAAHAADGWSDSWAGGANGLGRSYRAAIKADGDANTITNLNVKNCRFDAVYGACIGVLNADRITITENLAYDCDMEFAFILGDTATPATTFCDDVVIQGNRAYDIASGDGTVNANVFLIQSCTNVVLIGNVAQEYERNFCKLADSSHINISDNAGEPGSVTVTYPFVGLQSTNNDISDIVVADNVSIGHGQGIAASGGASKNLSRVTITGNLIYQADHATTGDGIQIVTSGEANDIVVANNTVVDPSRHGIYVTADITAIRIADNIFRKSGTASAYFGIYFNGTSYDTIEDVSISGNQVINFNGSNGSYGAVCFVGYTSITNFLFCENMVITEDDTTNFAFQEITSAQIVNGIITNNHFRGKFIVRSTSSIIKDNRITGTTNNYMTTVTDAGPTDDLDVTGLSVVAINTSGNNVTLGGAVGGVPGQILHIVVVNSSNNTTVEHSEVTGNQRFYLESGGDETKTGTYGGWTFVCNGDHWFQVK